MKFARYALSLTLIAVPILAVAQSDMHKTNDNAAPSDAEKSFTLLKTLAGTWRGSLKVDPPDPEMEKAHPQITMRVTSRGNALVHEMTDPSEPDDSTKYDHPVTMLYLETGRLYLMHYCDAGNRPRMVARTSPDGKTIEFDFVDLSGGNQNGHMHHVVFTMVDANHHTEDWTYMMPGDKPMHAHMDLTRGQ